MRGLKNALFWGAAGTLALTFITEESAWGRLWNLIGATIWVMPVSTLTVFIVGSDKKIDIQFKLWFFISDEKTFTRWTNFSF